MYSLKGILIILFAVSIDKYKLKNLVLNIIKEESNLFTLEKLVKNKGLKTIQSLNLYSKAAYYNLWSALMSILI